MNIALIYGGRSSEHDVSVNSAKGVFQALSNLGHTIYLVAITLEGRWFLQKADGIPKTISTDSPLTIIPGEGISSEGRVLSLDVAFAVTHGYGGEDGALQGLCLLANLPLCGCDIASSAIGMHKETATKLFALEGIPTIPSLVLDKEALLWLENSLDTPPSWIDLKEGLTEDRWTLACRSLQQKLGSALFIKPEDGGSSLGISALRLPNGATLKEALLKAKRLSAQVLVQPLIEPMDELECALLEFRGGDLFVAGPAQVVDPGKESNLFLSYEAKYSHLQSAYLQFPSTYSPSIEEEIRLYAKKAFRAIGAEGYARIDFFVSKERIYLNEINTSPGMGEKSHYPLLMQHAGYSMEKVVELLIDHALRRKDEERERSYLPPEA